MIGLLRLLDWLTSIMLPDHPDNRALGRARLILLFAQVLALIVIVGAILVIPAHGKTSSDEWLKLVAAIQSQPCPYKENRDDRAFLDRILNVLTLDEPPELTWRERRWLLTLKKECKL